MESNLKDSLPVVQGQSVGASVYGHSAGYPDIQSRGQHQPKRCNAVFWAILLLYVCMFSIVFLEVLRFMFKLVTFGYRIFG